jgi:hypothetical protein
MSTDTSTLLPNRVGVSDSNLYNLKPSCAKARTYRASIPAANAELLCALCNVLRGRTELSCWLIILSDLDIAQKTSEANPSSSRNSRNDEVVSNPDYFLKMAQDILNKRS